MGGEPEWPGKVQSLCESLAWFFFLVNVSACIFWCVGCTRTAPAKQLLRWQGAIKTYVYFFQLSNAGGAQDARGEMTDWLFAVAQPLGSLLWLSLRTRRVAHLLRNFMLPLLQSGRVET